jgi:hypothetical protein
VEFGPVKFQQGAIGVAEADFAGKSGDFGVVGGNVGRGWPLPCGVWLTIAWSRSMLIVNDKLVTAVGLQACMLYEGASCLKTVSNMYLRAVASMVEGENIAAKEGPCLEWVGVLGVRDPMTIGVINTSSSGRPRCIDMGWFGVLPINRLGMTESSPKCSWPAGFKGAMGCRGGEKKRS